MELKTETSPTAITLPGEDMARARRAEQMKADLDRAAAPGSNDGPVRGTTQPDRKGVQRNARAGG